MFALSKNLTTLRNFVTTCAAHLSLSKNITFANSDAHTHENATPSLGINPTIPNNLSNTEIQYPAPVHIAYQHQIVDRHPTLSMDEPRSSYGRELTPTPPPNIIARWSSYSDESFSSMTYSQTPIHQVPLDKGVIICIPEYGNFQLKNYECVLYNGRPYLWIEGSRIVAPPYINTSHLLVPWENFEISREILGWKEWLRLRSWYFTVPIRQLFGSIRYHLPCINDEESMYGWDE